MEEQPNYYAILTAEVRYDRNLKPNEKLLYAEITALSNKKGYCFATNSYFAELYGVDKTTISRYISHLEKCGYVKTSVIKVDNVIVERRIYAKDLKHEQAEKTEGIDQNIKGIEQNNKTPIDNSINTPIEQIAKENITSINNINMNNICNTSKTRKNKFVPPSIEECKNYISEKGLVIDGDFFFKYFSESNWIDSKGNAVRNWKQKMLTWNQAELSRRRQNGTSSRPMKKFTQIYEKPVQNLTDDELACIPF